jgi:hypothetical protein
MLRHAVHAQLGTEPYAAAIAATVAAAAAAAVGFFLRIAAAAAEKIRLATNVLQSTDNQ